MVSSVWEQRGQAADSVSFHLTSVAATPHCSVLNFLDIQRRVRRGESCMAVERPGQSRSGEWLRGIERVFSHSERIAARLQ